MRGYRKGGFGLFRARFFLSLSLFRVSVRNVRRGLDKWLEVCKNGVMAVSGQSGMGDHDAMGSVSEMSQAPGTSPSDPLPHTFQSSSDLAAATHPRAPGDPARTQIWWADQYDAMKVGDSRKLVNAMGDTTTITRTEDGWTKEG